MKPRQRPAMLSLVGRTIQAQIPYCTNHQPINHPFHRLRLGDPCETKTATSDAVSSR